MREHVRLGTEVVDGFRGLAILLVLYYHTWLFSWYTPALSLFGHAIPVDVPARTGYLGVDLFFLISGFVLFFPYAERTLAGGEEPTTGQYAYRRFIKIVPSFYLALAVTIPAVIAMAPKHTAFELVGTSLQHVLFIQNFFDDGFGQANSVFWSLAVEVQFYLVFPFVARFFKREPLVTAALMIVAALGYRYATATCCLQVQIVSRQLPAYLDVFAVGMLAAYAVVLARARFPNIHRYRLPATAAAIGFACAAFALLETANGVQYDTGGRERWDLGHRTLLAAAAGATIVASCFADARFRWLIANPILVFLSILSYNLYLWHTLVMIWMWKHGVPHAATANPHEDDHWKAAYITLGWTASIGISAAIAYFFERPLLGTVKRQTFAFDWAALVRRRGITSAPPVASRETRT